MSTTDVEVLVIVPVPDETLRRIAAIDPRVRVVDARGWFDVEIRETWPPRTVQRYLGQPAVHEGCYGPIALEGKTVCVVGAGGIGRDVGRLCASVGMRVIGTRRRVNPGDALPPGLTRLEPPDRLHTMLAESDCVAVCCQWTPETAHLLGRQAVPARGPVPTLVPRAS